MTKTRIAKFKDRDYRHTYAEQFLDTFIATQIRVLREQRGWTQAQLAERVGMKQSRISAVEDANYSGWTISTLKRLGRAFDVPLNVSYGTFGRLLAGLDDFNRAGLQRYDFDSDPAFRDEAPYDAEPQDGFQFVEATPKVVPFVRTRTARPCEREVERTPVEQLSVDASDFGEIQYDTERKHG